MNAALAAIVLAAACAMAFQPVRSPDVWHHLASGRLVAEKGGPASADVFSHTAHGRRWIQFEWLAQLALYGAWSAAGVPGLMLMRIAAVAGTAALLLLVARSRAGPGAAATAVALALCGMSARSFSRPEIFTWLLFAGMMLAVEKLRAGRHKLFFLPALLIVPWVNMHGAWIAGLAWLGLTCGGETVTFLVWKKSALPGRTLKFLWFALVLAFAATLVNPFGPRIWEVPFALSRSEEVTGYIMEWRRPTLDFWLKPRNVGVWVTLFALLLYARGPRLSDWLTVAFFGALSLTAVRHLALAMMVASPIVARQFALIGRAARVPSKMKRLLGGWSPRLIMTLLFCAALVAAALGGPSLPRAGWGLAAHRHPFAAADFLKRNHLAGNLYNSYDFGNLLMFELYPRNLVFIDGRVDMYGSKIVALYDRLRKAPPGWEEELRDRGIEVCVLKTVKTPDKPMLAALHKSSDWALVFWDDISAVYVKRSASRKGFLQEHYVYAVRPDEVDEELMGTRTGLARAERDYGHKLEEDPRCILALKGLSETAARAGATERAIRLMKTALKIAPDSADLHYNLGAQLLNADRLGEAEEQFRATIALGEYEGKAWQSLGVIQFRLGRLADAARSMEKAARHDPGNWKIWWNLSMVYEKRKDAERAARAVERVIELNPGHAGARKRLDALRSSRGAQP